MSTRISTTLQFCFGIALVVGAFSLGGAVAQDDGPAAKPAGSKARVAVIDLEAVVGQSDMGKQLRAQLEEFQKRVADEGAKLAKTASEIRKRIADGAGRLSDAELQKLQKDYEDASIAIRRFRDDRQREGQKLQNGGLRKIEKALEPVVTRFREEGGYDLILNHVAGVVVFADKRIDVTEQILQAFNRATAPK